MYTNLVYFPVSLVYRNFCAFDKRENQQNGKNFFRQADRKKLVFAYLLGLLRTISQHRESTAKEISR